MGNLIKWGLIGTSLLCILISCKRQADKTQKQYSISNEGQTKVGGPFENSEFTYYRIPKNITATDTSSGWKQNGQCLLLTGTVFEPDGKTPAPNVLLYYYHTNTEGRYVHKASENRSMPPNGLGQTHGYIRGWVKTDAAGNYAIYTVRPGVYPTRDEPSHIHITVKEPNDLKEYYIDDFVFDDDPLLTSKKRQKMENRCGSGVVRLAQKDDLWVGERNLILGLNIPGYPGKAVPKLQSGKNAGEDVFSFTPFHAWGPDKGTTVCPVCKYGWYHGILYFVGNNPNWDEIKQWLVFLENESHHRKTYLKAYFIYGNEVAFDTQRRKTELEKIGAQLQLKNVALTFVPSFSDTASEINLNKINQTVDNTFIIYRRNRITDKFINIKPTANNYKIITERLDADSNVYFNLPKPKHDE